MCTTIFRSSPPGELELNALFMFQPTNNRNTFQLINLNASRYHPVRRGVELELIVGVNKGIYHFKLPGQNFYLGFYDHYEVAYMDFFRDPNFGQFELELAGSQLSGTIVQFDIEGDKVEKRRNVSVFIPIITNNINVSIFR